MHFDFGVAAKFQGNTYLRFDDTNPAAEKQEYIDSILSSVSWLGHRPFKVTYSSDYFSQLHEFAVKLIKIGKAYVCHQAKAEVTASRQLLKEFQLHCARNNLSRQETPLPSGAESPYRHRSVEDNLRLFEEMSKGVWEEGSCCLRLKGDLRSDITSMWDLAAYRIKFQEHPHSTDAYCIYPTYDYTHCLVDSIENVTHSLCTLEFETRQAPNGPYYWLHALICKANYLGVFTMQHHLQRFIQTKTQYAGVTRSCFRMGRSTIAHLGRASQARIYPNSYQPFLFRDGYYSKRQHTAP